MPLHAQSLPAAAFDRLAAHLDDDATVLSIEQRRQENNRLRALIPPGDTARELRWRALACWSQHDDVQAGLAFAHDSLARARRAEDRVAEVRLGYCLGNHRELSETSQAALDEYARALRLAEATGDSRLIADGLASRGHVRSLLGDQGLALQDFFEAQRRYEAGGYRQSARMNLQSIAIAYRRMGEFDKAIEHFATSRVASRAAGDWSTLVLDLLQTAFAYEGLHQPDRAMAMYREAEDIARKHTTRYDVGAAYLGMTGALVMQRRFDEALAMAERTRREFAALRDVSNEGMIELYVGQAHAGLGRHGRALTHFDRAVLDFERSANERYLELAYPERAASLHALGRHAEAVRDFKHHLAVREALQAKLGDQRAQVLRYRFDAERRDDQNRRLAKENELRAQESSVLAAARAWQTAALALIAALVIVLGVLMHRQLAHTRRLRVLALTDELTGVANRRSIELAAEDAIAAARRSGAPLTALTFDIDRFKAINDTYGHCAGDEALARVARACQGTLRQFDRLGRTGGEEFLVLLPDTGLEAALPIAERLRQQAEALSFEDLAPGLRLTLSIGAATLRADETALEPLTRRADTALYRAKQSGRNRVEIEA
ncbi:GGDEF domain-containing protein [Cognatilysobacter bugurensis]|uniref:GGDEF domain-containing protein n=1 Tax=Cognatilysobacter bugurensis TaxID=543356 RepID=UPI0016756A59|nr:GGDEF domain-containing protein [Lysobacter bugurensis]